MTSDRHQARSLLGIRREADIQRGLGVLAFVVATTGSWWLLQGRLHSSVWLGVAGALTLAGTFLSEGRRARDEYTRLRYSDASDTAMTLTALRPAQHDVLATHRRRLLGFLVFGIVASVGGPGVNILIRRVTRDGASPLDLLAWVLFAFPVCLAVWMLPPRGLGLLRPATERDGGECNHPIRS
jgi:hypothetical protein